MNRLLDNVQASAIMAQLMAKQKEKENQNRLATHGAVQSPYKQFQQQYPQLDQYGRKVASGGFLKENVQKFDSAMANARGQAFGGQADTGEGNPLDYFGFGAMTAFHGSPHKFSKFSMDNIGTGEGAQAYGHGLYFAENPKVAQQYKNNLSIQDIYVDGKPAHQLEGLVDNTPPEQAIRTVLSEGGIDEAIAKLKHLESIDKDAPEYWKQSRRWLDSNRKRVELKGGSLYEVDIPDEHIKNFLDWDAPLSEQPESVRKALNKEGITGNLKHPYVIRHVGPEIGGSDFRIWHNGKPFGGAYKTRADAEKVRDWQNSLLETQGELVYSALEKKLGGRKQASDYLNKLGIKGIKYFDGSSRSVGQGTRNLVVFDDKIIKTLKRNNEQIK